MNVKEESFSKAETSFSHTRSITSTSYHPPCLPTHTCTSDSFPISNVTTCTSKRNGWLDLIERLGSFSRLNEILSEGLELVCERTGIPEAELVALHRQRVHTVAVYGTPDSPSLCEADLMRNKCPQPFLSTPVIRDNNIIFFLISKGKKPEGPVFFHKNAFAFWLCSLKAYASYLRNDPAAASSGGGCRINRMYSKIIRDFPDIITQSSEMIEVLSFIKKIAGSELPVLLQGESGTGKELAARAIHEKSSRSHKPYVAENCAAVPESLLESEFFGVSRGAFTGASRSRPGLFSLAEGGTLFLDEIAEMPTALQKKLLRVLQEQTIRKVGNSTSEQVNVRIIAATNLSLKKQVFFGSFRKDLFFRLNTITITLPTLKKRKEDIPLLAEHFLREFAVGNGLEPGRLHLSEGALESLLRYQWPGNIRELKNEIFRSAVLTRKGIIHPFHLSDHIRSGAKDQLSPEPQHFLSGNTSLPEFERHTIGTVIENLLNHLDRNKTECARVLGISKTSLYRRMRRYGLM